MLRWENERRLLCCICVFTEFHFLPEPSHSTSLEVYCYFLKVSTSEFTASGSAQNPWQGQKEREGQKKKRSPANLLLGNIL